MKTIMQAIAEQAEVRGDELAFHSPLGTWTFRELERTAGGAAAALAAAGVGPGDRVACLTKHTAECVALTLAANKVGAVCMPVNWRLAPPEIEYIVNHGKAKLLMADGPFLEGVSEIEIPTVARTLATEAAADGRGHESFRAWAGAHAPLAEPYPAAPEDTALQLYSSGTTGLPKGVELTHANLSASLLGPVPRAVGYEGPGSVMLNALPTYHIAGVGIGLLTAALGGASILQPDFAPGAVIEAIPRFRVTHAFLVPAMIQLLLQTPGVEEGDYTTLEVISYGASPITEPVLIGAMRTFRCAFVQVYGLTETTGAVTALCAEDHDPEGPRRNLLRSAGRPIEGVEVRVVDPATGADCPEGEVGEIWIRTAQNMKGYWRNDEETSEALVADPAGAPAWFRSGDAGYLEGDYVFLHDRIKDMIVSGGENIYPAEVENVLMQHPGVADGAVIGVPDEKWGETVMACVVVREGPELAPEALIGFMRERLAHYKCPQKVVFLAEVPRNPTGKILKRVLREPYWQGETRRVH